MSKRCDVLIVGGGGAALRAALAAHDADDALDVLLVTKGVLGASGVTATACSDRMAFHATLETTEPGGADAWRHHADDIYRIGGQVSDADLAEVLAAGAAEAFHYLDNLGVPWARRADGVVDQFVTDGSLYARACYTGPHTANHIHQALLQRLRETPIRVLEQQMVADLLRDDEGAVCGALLVSETGEDVGAVAASAVVLATGGAGQVFDVNVFPADCTGDGMALAYRVGAELVNLEFIQIGLSSVKTKLACSGSMFRALPELVNEVGDEFLARYMPPGVTTAEMYAILFSKGASWPVSYREPSHIVDIAVSAERAAGHTVYLDYGSDPVGLNLAALSEPVRVWFAERGVIPGREAATTPIARLQAINPPSIAWLAERGIDLLGGDRIELAPAIQHFQGGVKIRRQGETTVPGLFAAGETAGGQHGANRPGGNALLDSQVFGKVAGESAAAHAAEHPCKGVVVQDPRGALRSLLIGTRAPDDVRRQVGGAMANTCAVYRTPEGLASTAALLEDMANAGVSCEGAPLAQSLEALNVLQVAHMIVSAAQRRDESRGPHLRFPREGDLTPLPRDDARWSRYLVLTREPDGPKVECREPVRPDGSV